MSHTDSDIYPALIKNALDTAKTYADAGILFVPMPCANGDEAALLQLEASTRLDEMISEANAMA